MVKNCIKTKFGQGTKALENTFAGFLETKDNENVYFQGFIRMNQ